MDMGKSKWPLPLSQCDSIKINTGSQYFSKIILICYMQHVYLQPAENITLYQEK